MLHALFLTLLMAATPAPPPASHFRIAFTRTTAGYTAECASGCKWTALAFECGDECTALIDESGVRIGTEAKIGDPVFAFRFHRTADGFRLVSLGGTGWTDLSWGCGVFSCTAHVDESGVSGSAVGG